MDPLVLYYRRQAGCGREDIGPIYSIPPFVQRGHGLGDFWQDCLEHLNLFSGVVPNL